MRYLILFLLPVLALFLQSTFFASYNIKNALPDLVLVFVIFYALLNDAKKAGCYGFLCGLLEDLLLGRFIGINALAKGLTGYIIGALQGHVFKENLAVGVLSVLVGTFLHLIFLFVISLLSTAVFELNQGVFITLFYQALLNSILAVPLYVWYYNSFRFGFLKVGRGR